LVSPNIQVLIFYITAEGGERNLFNLNQRSRLHFTKFRKFSGETPF
jgi:hypothetical protein